MAKGGQEEVTQEGSQQDLILDSTPGGGGRLGKKRNIQEVKKF